ncbi:MAG: AAA family ATPase [Flavobacteriaceae bacterium]|nr:AAA family ATPase [Flavobacteriaceae bacterium]MBL6678992.1 AAA family ATPase [Flavobacteriaceae bacterium]
MYNVIILFGVSGCGKSLIGNRLSKDLQFEFIEGDDFHSNENIKKMKNNIPLNDDDREVWLDQINNELNKLKNKNVVIACSALKEIYRKRLVKGIVAKIDWFCLKGPFYLIEKRLDNRGDHYFKSTLLKSQFDTIEYPDYCTFIDIVESPDMIVQRIKSAL